MYSKSKHFDVGTFSSYCKQRTEPVCPVSTLWCCCSVWRKSIIKYFPQIFSLDTSYKCLFCPTCQIPVYPTSWWCCLEVPRRFWCRRTANDAVIILLNINLNAGRLSPYIFTEAFTIVQTWDNSKFVQHLKTVDAFAVLASAVDPLQIVLPTSPVVLDRLQCIM